MPGSKLNFGKFELDTAAHELRERNRVVKLERLPMDLLRSLLERPGELLTREELAERLWGNMYVDFENGINTAIRKLRTALRDNPDSPTFVQTVPGRGYRFIAPVKVVKQAPASTRLMLAVLPFQDLSPHADQEYFVDGLTEETISQLGRLDPVRLGVISRTSSMRYKDTRKSIGQIGSELGIDFVLESSLRRENDQLRITSQLIRVADETHVWVGNYNRDTASFLGVQQEVGEAIASEVKLSIVDAGTRARVPATHDPTAYDFYLRGRHAWNLLTPVGLAQAIEYFQKAIARDQTYALAYAGLSDAYSMLPITCDSSTQDVLSHAAFAAAKAVELDTNLAECWSALGTVKLWLEWDWAAAEKAFHRALELNPSYVNARRYYGHLLADIGRHEESAVQMRIARELDPLSPLIHGLSGHLRYFARDYTGALNYLKHAIELSPKLWVLYTWMGRICGMLDQSQLALECLQSAFELSGRNSEVLALKAYTLARTDRRHEALELLKTMMEWSSWRYIPPYNIALIHSGMGNMDDATAYLTQAYKERDVRMTFLGVEPRWDWMRRDSRFHSLINQLRL